MLVSRRDDATDGAKYGAGATRLSRDAGAGQRRIGFAAHLQHL
jgi:hypothetical protein